MRVLIAGRFAPGTARGEARYLERMIALLSAHEVDVVTAVAGNDLRAKVGLELAVRRRATSFRPDRIVAFAPEVPSGIAPTTGVLGPLAPRADKPSGLGRLRGRIRAARTQGRTDLLVPSRIAAERRPKGTPQVFHPGPGPSFLGGPRATAPADGALRVVQVGSLRADKGVHLTVEAMQSLTRERGRVELHLVGLAPDPSYVARLKRRSDGVTIHIHSTPVSLEGRARLLASAHILSAPATADGTWGFALNEAMAAGLPVVCSNIDDHRELVGKAGVEAQAGDVKQLGSAFRKLLRDREHWTARSEAGRAQVESRYGDESAIRARLCRLLGLS